MKHVKPIETRYKGYCFRSRLEARWAVFFDSLGIKYEYELEGYTLPSGAGYLPDFFLPDLGLHVEIKPSEKVAYHDLNKVVEFSLQGDHALLLIIGTPTQESMFLIDRRHDPLIEEIEANFDEPANEEEVVSIAFECLRDWCSVQFGLTPFSRKWVLLYKSLPPNEDHALQEALLKAKQARFEFGEKG